MAGVDDDVGAFERVSGAAAQVRCECLVRPEGGEQQRGVRLESGERVEHVWHRFVAHVDQACRVDRGGRRRREHDGHGFTGEAHHRLGEGCTSEPRGERVEAGHRHQSEIRGGEHRRDTRLERRLHRVDREDAGVREG